MTAIANPQRVTQLIERLLNKGGEVAIAVHFHNSRGAGLANVLAAYQAGIRILTAQLEGSAVALQPPELRVI